MRLRLTGSVIAMAMAVAAFPAAALVSGVGATTHELRQPTNGLVAKLVLLDQTTPNWPSTHVSDITHDLVDHRRDRKAERLARRSQALWHR